MPNVVDFSPLRGDPYAGALDPVIAALTENQRAGAAEKARQEQLAFQREQEQRRMLMEQDKTNHERQLEAAAQRKQQGIETVANNKGREQADQAIRAAVGVGDLAEARRRAGAYSEVDPVTGSVVNGRPFEVNPVEGPAPPTPQPRPIEEGPQASPDEAANAGLIRGAQQAPGDQSPELGAQADQQQMAAAEAERQRFAQASTPDQGSTLQQQGNQLIDPQQVAVARQAAWRQQQANPAVTIGGVQTTPEAIRYSKARADAADFGKLGEALAANHAQALQVGDPLALQASERRMQVFQEVMPLVASGSMSPQAAQARIAAAATGADRYVDQSRLTTQRAGDAASLQGQRDTASMARTQVTTEAAAQRAAAGGEKAAAVAAFKEKQAQSGNLRKDIKTFKEDYNAKTTQEAAQKFPNITEMLQSGNGRLQKQALMEMYRIAQQDNRYSDADDKMNMKVGVGWLDSLENYISKGETGEFAPGVVANATQAAQVLNKFYQQKAAKMNEEADSFLDPSMYNPHEAAQILGRELPGFKERHPEMFGRGAPAPATAPASPAGAAGPSSGGPPPGAVLQRNKKTGEERWRLPDGTTVPR